MRVLAFLAVLLFTAPGWAINQPRGGPRIPVGNDLQSIFDRRSDMLRAQDDAAVMPERFVPGCNLTFTLVARGSATFQNVFGWYNVTPGSRPTGRDLHVLIPCDARAGDRFTLSLRGNPDYRGGEIGFFLRTPENGSSGTCAPGACCADLSRTGNTFFSERRYNPDNPDMGTDSYIHLLIYDSRATPSAFYFAWEDLFSGGDNNFTDFVALVDQIVCTGGGGSCNTGRMGACAQGTQQCRNGALACLGSVEPSAERCDGVDNDCNGMTDEGDALCPSMQVCDRGVCVDRCLSELGCFPGLTCTDRGTCVEATCATVRCDAGQRCTAGRCVDACDGITCPRGLTCRAGRCLDACAGVTCDSDQVCSAGACVPRCECRPCAAGQTCGADGACRASDCATVTCAAGRVCMAGACVDACEGARCPLGERCEVGRCVAIPLSDAGVARDVMLGEVARSDLDVPTVRADAGKDAGMDAEVDGGVLSLTDRGGCQCHTRAAGHAAGPWALAALGVAAMATRRRRRAAR